MRRLLLTASITAALVALAQPAQAQITFGVQGAALTGFEVPTGPSTVVEADATYGLGARALFSPPIPLLSLSLVGQGVYYFPESGSYMSYGLGARFGLGLPLITPYLIGGWQWRRTSPDGGGDAVTANGFTGGLGVELNLPAVPFGIFLEGTAEIGEEIPSGTPDYDNTALVIQAGVIFGG